MIDSIFNRPTLRPGDGNLTAASLIDAIITHQINQTATDPPMRDGHRPPFVSIFTVQHIQTPIRTST